MKQDTVNWLETFRTVAEQAWPISVAAPEHRYSLAVALRVVREMETSPGRAAAFEEIKSKNRLYRLVDTLYSKSGILQPLALLAYMMKCVVSVGPFDEEGAEAVGISNFPNERHTVDRVAALVADGSQWQWHAGAK